MTYISRKTRLLVPRYGGQRGSACPSKLVRKRSDGRMKEHSSCTDMRAWVVDEIESYQYFLELMTDEEDRPLSKLSGRYIPLQAIINLLCGKINENTDWKFLELEAEKPKKLENVTLRHRDISSVDIKESANENNACDKSEDLLKLLDAAMSKLETIQDIVRCYNSDDLATRRKACPGMKTKKELVKCKNLSLSSLSCNNDQEDFSREYNKTMSKIDCLEQKLRSVQKCRDQLNAKIQSLRNGTKSPLDADSSITELYKREAPKNVAHIQEEIEYLSAQRGKLLEEMCSSLKYVRELRKKIDSKGKTKKCACSCMRHEGKRNSGKQNDNVSSKEEETGKTWNSDVNLLNGEGHILSNRNITQPPIKDTNSMDPGYSRASSVTFLPFKSNIASIVTSQKDELPERKTKSDSAMIEQKLKNYEKRLKKLSCLESDVEDLKKGAAMAQSLKNKLINSLMKIKNQNMEEKVMKWEMSQLKDENCKLRSILKDVRMESEKEQNEMQRLRCEAMKIIEMKEELTKLKHQINDYQSSWHNENECIGILKNTILGQRDEIERLTLYIASLIQMKEKCQDVKRSNKNVLRSRSLGLEMQNTSQRQPPPLPFDFDHERNHMPCSCYTRNHFNSERLARPRSECETKSVYHYREFLPHLHTYRHF